MKLPLSLATDLRPVDALTVGENSVDLVAALAVHPEPDSKQAIRSFAEFAGGEAATAAVGLARLGWRVRYIGRFGDDHYGDRGCASLRAEGVDIDEVVRVPAVTSRLAIVIVDSSTGQRSVLWQRAPELHLRAADVSDTAVADSRVLLVGGDDLEATVSVTSRARTLGTRTVGDLDQLHAGTDALLPHLDVPIVSANFLARFAGVPEPGLGLRRLADAAAGAAMVCVTLGAEGCLALVDGQEFHMPAFAIGAVDTTGAGDLFRAGFIARWLLEPTTPDVEALLRYGCATGALNCRALGAQTAAPTRAEVDALLQR